MYKKWGLYLSLVTLFTGSVYAHDIPAPGQFEVFGEFIYFMPTFDDNVFVIESPAPTTFPNGKRRNNDFKFYPGFRVGAAYAFCEGNRGLELFYTHLEAKHNKTIDGNFLWATQGTPDFVSVFENYAGSASSSLKATYQNVEAKFSQQTLRYCGVTVAVQAGLEYANLQHRENYEYINLTVPNVGTIQRKSDVWGVGPQLGTSISYELFRSDCGCPSALSLFASASASLLGGQAKITDSDILAGVSLLDITEDSTWLVIPAFHAKMGINYDISFSGLDTYIEVGYEFNTYLRGLSRARFVDDVADGLSFNHRSNFDLQGLYATLALRF